MATAGKQWLSGLTDKYLLLSLQYLVCPGCDFRLHCVILSSALGPISLKLLLCG